MSLLRIEQRTDKPEPVAGDKIILADSQDLDVNGHFKTKSVDWSVIGSDSGGPKGCLWDGTGSTSILGSSGISSITKLSAGIYKVSFTNPFSDAFYRVSPSCRRVFNGSFGHAHMGCGDVETRLLMHLDGANNSTVFTDLSQYANTVSAQGGTVISTGQSKFGGASALFNGSSSLAITDPGNSIFNIRTGVKFIMDLWIRFSSLATDQQIWSRSGTGYISNPWDDANGNHFSLAYVAGDSKLHFTYKTPGNGGLLDMTSPANPFVTNTWYHIMMSGDGTTMLMFIDGTSVSGGSQSDFFVPNSIAYHNIGSGPNNAQNWVTGNIDEPRLLIGQYVDTNFTPPASAYSTPDNAQAPGYCYIETEVGGTLTDMPIISAIFA